MMHINVHDAFARWLLLMLAGVGLCMIALLMTRVLGNRSAATRATVWQSLAAALLALPLVSVLPWGIALPSSFLLSVSGQPLPQAASITTHRAVAGPPRPNLATPDLAMPPTPPTEREFSAAEKSAMKTSFESRRVQKVGSVSTTDPAGARPDDGATGSLYPFHAVTLVIWFAGVFVLLTRLAAAHVTARRHMRNAHESPSARLRQILQSLSGPQPRLLLSESVSTPAVVGLVRPSILLPSCATRWSDERIKMVLLHESAHIARRDTIWHSLFVFNGCLTWPNPLVWWGLHQFVQERERACDDRVLQEGHSPIAYGEMLVDMVASCSRGFISIQRPSVAMARPPIQQRLAGILDANIDRTPATRRQCLLTVASFLTFAVTIGVLRPGLPDRVQGQENQPAAKADPRRTNQGGDAGELVGESSERSAGFRFQIENEEGAPIEAAEVKLFRWNGEMNATKFVRRTPKNGRIQFAKMPRGQIYVRVTAEGYVPTLILLRKPMGRERTIILSRAAKTSLTVTNANGELLEGAQIQYVLYNDINKTRTFINSSVAAALPLTLEASDAKGNITLPRLPEGVSVKVSVIHPDWASATLEFIAKDEVNQRVQLEAGARFDVTVKAVDDPRDLEGKMVEITMLHPGDFRGDGGVFAHSFPIRNGKLHFTAGQFNFTEFRAKIDGYFVGPLMINFPDAPIDELNLLDKQQTSFTLKARKKVRTRGRVVDYEGNPMRGVDVHGALIDSDLLQPGQSVDQLSQAERMKAVTVAGSATSGPDGFYEVDLASGSASIEAIHHGHYALEHGVTFEVDAEGTTVPPDIVLLPVPNLTGWIRDENGQSAENVIVRMVSKGRGDARPVVVTGATGEFQLNMTRIPYTVDGDGLETTAHVLAFDPTRRYGDIVEVDLMDPKQTKDIPLQLQPQHDDFFLNPLGQEKKELELTDEVIDYLARLKQRHAAGAPGQTVPSAQEGTWFNTDANRLEDFRGRFVLLDFWFIGCGPCHRDMPQLKAAHAAFPKDKFVVVGIHNNSSPPDQVEAFLEKRKIEYATVVDDNRGRIARQFEPLGLRGYPFYILLDPDGKIVHNDAFSAATSKSLRMQKLELIHEAILSWDW